LVEKPFEVSLVRFFIPLQTEEAGQLFVLVHEERGELKIR